MSRRDIHSWKCDRPAAFRGNRHPGTADAALARDLAGELRRHFQAGSVTLAAGPGQGNHLTWTAEVDGQPLFIRVENGPEADGHLAVESAVLDRVREVGVPTPRVFGCDVSRRRVGFAWQALERFPHTDLNRWLACGTLDRPLVAREIGRAVATWQGITPDGFGVLDPNLRGYRSSYADYFHLRLDEHLAFLVQHGFLARPHRDEIRAEIELHGSLLGLARGCLVHKDLALWNILGAPGRIVAFIDFDDAISGDPLDDLSLLACFHDGAFLGQAFTGYTGVRPLPVEARRRFWLHLLRNMIVKAVIRVGGGYFERGPGFLLVAGPRDGATLRRFTEQRIERALQGLRDNDGVERL